MTKEESKELTKAAVEALEDKKARDVRVLDISEVSVIADYFIIASGANKKQVQALVDNVEEALASRGCVPKQTEGYQSAGWILMDYGDIVVHIFDEENRLFYDLEHIWKDGKELSADEL